MKQYFYLNQIFYWKKSCVTCSCYFLSFHNRILVSCLTASALTKKGYFFSTHFLISFVCQGCSHTTITRKKIIELGFFLISLRSLVFVYQPVCWKELEQLQQCEQYICWVREIQLINYQRIHGCWGNQCSSCSIVWALVLLHLQPQTPQFWEDLKRLFGKFIFLR